MRSISLALGLLLSLSFSTQADVSATPIAAADAKKQTIEKTIDLVIDTSMGKIEVELNAELAPISVANFMQYVESGFYNGTIFHRVINNFMVQGGGLDENMAPKPTGTEPIQNEANNGLKNDRGTLAMARTMDPHSATGQFFINHKDNDFLNHTSETSQGWGYAVFGSVIDGMDIVDQIALSTTSTVGGYADAPLEPTTINSVTVSE